MFDKNKISKEAPVIAWFSGGCTSAVTCKLCIEWFGLENVRLVFIDTKNEHPDTYRFITDCEEWYGKKIEIISNTRYDNIQDVWYENLSLNIAHGAKCSQMLKIVTRQQFCKKNNFSYHAFGFDVSEVQRAKNMKNKNSYLNPIFPLIYELLSKKDCIRIIEDAGEVLYDLLLPLTYRLGYNNNNCFQTGCVKGGIGYWQKIQIDSPEKFNQMAAVEHDLTDLKGEPVTMLKDQAKGGGLVFLKPHPKYPQMKDISMMKGRPVEKLTECSGFCSNSK